MKKLYNILNTLPEWAFLAIYLSSILLYSIFIGLQGLDMTDEGWASTGFQQIYNDASTISGLFTIYDTLLVGGLFHLLFPSLGMIAFRIASALCLTVVAYIVYLLLKDVINRWYIFLGVALCVVNTQYILVLHYNYTAALISVLIALFLYRAVTAEKAYYILIAGIITGIGFFFRLPNICLCGMIAILIPYHIYTRSAKRTLILLSYAILGVLIGVMINLSIIFLLHHQEPFKEMLTMSFSAITHSDSTHNSSSLLHLYTSQTKVLITFIAFFLAFPFVDYYVYNKISNKWLANSSRTLLILLFIWKLSEKFYRIILLYAFCIISLIYNIFSQPKNQKLVYLSVLALLSMILVPLGSDNGFYNVGTNATFIALPLAIGSLFSTAHSILKNDSYISIFKKYVLAFFIYVIIGILYSITTLCFHDPGSRLEKTHRPTLTAVATTYTTQHKAEELDSLFFHLQPLVNNNTYLLAYPSLPAINCISLTKPYLTQPWIGIMDYYSYIHSFEKAKGNKPLPIIVVRKSTYADWSVGNEHWSSILDCEDRFPSIKEKNEYLLCFIRENNYSVVWEDNCFQILLPFDK